MPTLGAVASSFRFSGQFLDIAEDIETIRTTNRIYLRNDAGENEWSFGMDGSRNWTLHNEHLNEDTIISYKDSQRVFIPDLSGGTGGGGGGATTLDDLTDVCGTTVQGAVMYHDSTTSKYRFTSDLQYDGPYWYIRKPLNYISSDIEIFNFVLDVSKNVHIGGTKRLNPVASSFNNISIGNGAGRQSQGVGVLTKGSCVAIGVNAGDTSQNYAAIAIGKDSGLTSQGENAIAIGDKAGKTSQGIASVSIGAAAGLLNQGINSISVGYEAGTTSQGTNSIALGTSAGITSQKNNSIAIGYQSGLESQSTESVAIGHEAGKTSMGADSVCIGHESGKTSMGADGVCIGHKAGKDNFGSNAVSIGFEAGQTDLSENCVAIGSQAGLANSGKNSIYIGEEAGVNGNSHQNVIVLNATGANLNPDNSNSTFLKPLRNNAGSSFLKYDATSGEVTYNTDIFQEQMEQPQVNTPSGTGNLQLINGAISGTLNRLSYTPPAIPAIPAPPPSRYATSYVNQALSSGLFQLSFSNAFTPVGITTSNLNVFTIQATGIYQLTYNINAIGSSTWNWHYLNIYKNSTNFQKSYFYSPTSVSQHTCHGGGFIVSLVAGDMWQFDVWSNGTSTVTGYASINQIA